MFELAARDRLVQQRRDRVVAFIAHDGLSNHRDRPFRPLDALGESNPREEKSPGNLHCCVSFAGYLNNSLHFAIGGHSGDPADADI